MKLGEMIDEWKLYQEMNNTNHSPWSTFKNGGVLENEFVNSDGEIEQMYWIDNE